MRDRGVTPVIMDVDTGVDDAAAIALAVHLPLLELLGVTTVAGNVDVEKTTENSLRVLSMLGASSVPVFRGMSRPLVRAYNDASLYHGQSGVGDAVLDPSPVSHRAETAPEFIIKSVRERPGEISLICVAPLTNIAVALSLEPDLPRLVDRVVIMGGAFQCPGNSTPFAEYNIWADPEAAAAVAASALPITFIGLDVTHKVPFTREQWGRLEHLQGVEPKLIYALLRRSFVTRGRLDFPLHDPLAVGVAAFPELVRTRSSGVAVETGTAETAGRVSLVEQPNTPRHQVALEVESAAFLTLFAETLKLA